MRGDELIFKIIKKYSALKRVKHTSIKNLMRASGGRGVGAEGFEPPTLCL